MATMRFQRILDHVEAELDRRDWGTLFVESGSTRDPETIQRRVKAANVAIEPELLEFYSSIGDGVDLIWSPPDVTDEDLESDDDGLLTNSNASFLTLNKALHFIESGRGGLSGRTWRDPKLDMVVPIHDEDAAGDRIGLFPILDHENGCAICVDADQGGAVVQYNAFWYDRDFDLRTQVLAPNLLAFFESWSEVIFQTPQEFAWSFESVSSSFNWKGNVFDQQYRIDSVPLLNT